MTSEQRQAYDWALNQQHQSVAARYARALALYIKEHNTALDEAREREDDWHRSWRLAEDALEATTRAAQKVEAKLELLRQAECLHCGRSLPPDGDCYGCEVDRMAAQVVALREGLEKVLDGIRKARDWREAYEILCGLQEPIRALLSAPTPRADALLNLAEAAEWWVEARCCYYDESLDVLPFEHPGRDDQAQSLAAIYLQAGADIEAALDTWRGR